jgi:hypothetical protein
MRAAAGPTDPLDVVTYERVLERAELRWQQNLMLWIGAAWLVLAYAGSVPLAKSTLLRLTGEDDLVEVLGTCMWLIGSVTLLLDYLKHARPTQLWILKSERSIYSLALAIVFFLAFGEEISWGQRIFDLTPPDALGLHNIQGEITIHNLQLFNPLTSQGQERQGWIRLFNFSVLFNAAWFAAFVVIPCSAYSAGLRRAYLRWGLPVAPLGFGLLMLINYMLLKVIGASRPIEVRPALTEIAETNFALLFMLVAFALWVEHEALERVRSETRVAVPVPVPEERRRSAVAGL